MRKNALNAKNVKIHDIILSGGPPWGFTLTGGSEFGSMLYVSKVTDDRKTVYGTLHTGDQILSVNGVTCISHANAIQMVREIEHELRLKVCRRNNDGSKTNIHLEERQNSQAHSDSAHHTVDNMSEISKKYFSIKQNSMNYKIISINKDENTNEHSIRIGITDEPVIIHNKSNSFSSIKDDDCVDGTKGRIPFNINPSTSPSSQQQKISLKMMPISQGATKYANSKAKSHSVDDSRLVYPTDEHEHENIESEPLKPVSTARAMFENMSSSSDRLKNISKSKTKPYLKSWNSSSLLDSCDTDKSKLAVHTKSTKLHEYSKSLPIDISEKEYEQVVINYKEDTERVSSLRISKQNKDNISDCRLKSGFHYEDKKKNLKSNTRNGTYTTRTEHSASHSEILTYNNNTLEQQMSSLPSYSSEDLRHYGKDDPRGRQSGGTKNDSANELRQAASKYHKDVIKNFPKYRNAITGKENAHKFSARKASMPTEEPFARGEPIRATIATTSAVRMPRSYSTNDTSEIDDLRDVLTSENSMMSRLLRDHSNPASLMKIDEENKSGNVGGNTKVLRRRNSLNDSENISGELDRMSSDKVKHYNDSHISTITPEMKSVSSPTERNSPFESREESSNVKYSLNERGRYNNSKSAGSIVPGLKSINIQTDSDLPSKGSEKSLNIKRGSSHGAHSKMKELPKPASDTAVKEIVQEDIIYETPTVPVERFPSPVLSPSPTNINNEYQQPFSSNLNDEEGIISISRNISGNRLYDYTHVETDIDAEDPPNIMHTKDPSTDSAVYVMDNQISHVKALSNESTDSMQEYSELSYKQRISAYDGDSSPAPPDDLEMQYDGDDGNEKEKPQRTINRRKKDSPHVNSRNDSCVSTDSTTSTATIDSGICVRSESQRASPLSNDSYYNNKDLTGSRETLDDDVAALSDESRVISTPERNEQAKTAGYQLLMGKSYGISPNHTPVSSDENSRRDSLQSPRSADIDTEKAKLVSSMREKIGELRDQEQEIADEIKMNEELGKKVLDMVKEKATQVEFSKFTLFIGELNKIVDLLLLLTQRLHRYELTLQDLDMSDEADKAKKDGLISKIDKLKGQHEEACYLRDVNDKRGDTVASFLERYCTEEEFADFQYYVDMKSQLALMQSEIREKVKLGEERLKALERTSSDWDY